MALISAERLHRWKCQFCGSKDKNIYEIQFPIDGETSSDGQYADVAPGIKIVSCNQCGKTEIFSHSSKLLASILVQSVLGGVTGITLKASEEFVNNFHDINHSDPKRNPHTKDMHGIRCLKRIDYK